jgi:signal transduction histidine kinase
MDESYSAGTQGGARTPAGPAHQRAEPPAELTLARELLAQLLPGADAALLVAGLMAERSAPPRSPSLPAPRDSELDAPARELRRVRAQLAAGAAARGMQHAMNNPLTALLAEAQLLELEPLADEHRLAIVRMVELARRVAAVIRQLDGTSTPTVG